jgi:hypothetical protein
MMSSSSICPAMHPTPSWLGLRFQLFQHEWIERDQTAPERLAGEVSLVKDK